MDITHSMNEHFKTKFGSYQFLLEVDPSQEQKDCFILRINGPKRRQVNGSVVKWRLNLDILVKTTVTNINQTDEMRTLAEASLTKVINLLMKADNSVVGCFRRCEDIITAQAGEATKVGNVFYQSVSATYILHQGVS